VTEIDFQQAHLPRDTIRVLSEIMPATWTVEDGGEAVVNSAGKGYDCEYLLKLLRGWGKLRQIA
jgi:hypothetical protein